MMSRFQLSLVTAAALVCAAGSAASAQVNGQPAKDKSSQRQEYSASPRLVFVSADKIRDMDVFNANHETSGEIEDLVIDRGTGRISHLVVETDSSMNLGGKTLVIPYNAFAWDEQKKHLMLTGVQSGTTPWPEFSKDRWQAGARDESSLLYSLSSDYYRRSPADRMEQTTEPERLQGRVKQIERRAGENGSEVVVVTVITDDKREEQVVVGPSWYLAGNSITFFRDNPVDLHIAHADRGGQKQIVARSVGTESGRAPLYDNDGWPMWNNDRTQRVDGKMPTDGTQPANPNAKRPGETDPNARARLNTLASPLVLASELDGKTINCRNETCGEVYDLIVECMSGRVAFVSIDPDENVLGIGDTKRLIPWGIVTPGSDNKIWLDASRAMIVSAPEAPSDMEAFATDGIYKRVYTSFDSPAVDFTPVRR